MSRPVEPALPPSTLCGTWLLLVSLSLVVLSPTSAAGNNSLPNEHPTGVVQQTTALEPNKPVLITSQRLLAVARQLRRQTTESNNKTIPKYQEVTALAHEVKDPVWEATALFPTCSTDITQGQGQKQKALDVGNQALLVNKRLSRKTGSCDFTTFTNLRLEADLVVISACQTVLGKDIKGEGLV